MACVALYLGVNTGTPVTGTLQGHEMLERHPKMVSKYGIHVANGPAELDTGKPYYVQVMNSFNMEV